MHHKAVIVRLSDLAVFELSLPIPRSHFGSSEARHLPHQRGPSVTASKVASFVASLVEGDQAIPAGVRGEQHSIAMGKKASSSPKRLSTMPADSAENRWTGCEAIRLSSTTGLRRTLYLLTRGTRTFVVLPAFVIAAPALSEPALSDANTNLIRPTVLHTFTWPEAPVKAVAQLREDILSSSFATAAVHLTLTAVTKSGISIQEGLVSRQAVERAFTSNHYGNVGNAFFEPVGDSSRAAFATPFQGDADMEAHASLDYGKRVGFLCRAHPWQAGASLRSTSAPNRQEGSTGGRDDEQSLGILIFTSALSDFPLKFIT
jgi:hypothetical protein